MKDAVLKTKGEDNLHTVNMKGDYALNQDNQDSFHPIDDIIELQRHHHVVHPHEIPLISIVTTEPQSMTVRIKPEKLEPDSMVCIRI